jgi:hypothetical protein
MPLFVAGEDEQGIVWIIDRKADKTMVMLACSPQAPESAGVAPDGEQAEDIYPLLSDSDNVAILDVTEVESGLQRFQSARIIRRLLGAASRRQSVTLTRSDLAEWGLQRPDTGPTLSF